MNTGKVVVFEGNFSSNWKLFELVPFLVTSALGGVLSFLLLAFSFSLLVRKSTSRLTVVLAAELRSLRSALHQAQPAPVPVQEDVHHGQVRRIAP
jgi:H+/Cl- antiporter ClcA